MSEPLTHAFLTWPSSACVIAASSTQGPVSYGGGPWGRKHWQKRLFTYLFNDSHRKQLFVYEGLHHLSMEPKHLRPSRAFRPDYYMRVFPQPARADYPTCYNRCQLIFLPLPAVCAAGLQAIFRIIADVNLRGFIGRDWKTGQATRHGPSFGFQLPLYNRQPWAQCHISVSLNASTSGVKTAAKAVTTDTLQGNIRFNGQMAERTK